jgi:DNA-binding protein Alba
MKDVRIKGIKIGTERVTNIEGRNSNVSSIEIDLTNNKKKR